MAQKKVGGEPALKILAKLTTAYEKTNLLLFVNFRAEQTLAGGLKVTLQGTLIRPFNYPNKQSVRFTPTQWVQLNFDPCHASKILFFSNLNYSNFSVHGFYTQTNIITMMIKRGNTTKVCKFAIIKLTISK